MHLMSALSTLGLLLLPVVFGVAVEYRSTEYGFNFDNPQAAANRAAFISSFYASLQQIASSNNLSFHLAVDVSQASGEYKEQLTLDTATDSFSSRGGGLHVRNFPTSNTAECILKFTTPDPNLIKDAWCPVFPTTSHSKWATETKLEQNLFIEAHGQPIITEYWQRSPKLVATPADFAKVKTVKDVEDLFDGASSFYKLPSGSTPLQVLWTKYMWDHWGILLSIGKSSPTVIKGGLQFMYTNAADAQSGTVAPEQFEFTFRVKQPATGWDDKVLARAVELLAYLENEFNSN